MAFYQQLGVEPGITAVIGSGGKTSLLGRLAEEVPGTVILCTTTHIRPFPAYPLLTEPTPEIVRQALANSRVLCLGTPCENNKLTAPALPLDVLAGLADYVLVEADGSAGRPFKAHADWEPVLPEERQATVLVMGADGFGKPISRMAHRPELYARLAGATEDQEVTPELAARVVRLEGLHDRVFLNQVDRAEEWPLARRLAAALDCPVTAGTLREGRWQRLK